MIIAFIEKRNLKSFKGFLSEFVEKSSRNLFTYQAAMVSTRGTISKERKGSEMLVKGVEWEVPNFKLVPTIAESLDPHEAQS